MRHAEFSAQMGLVWLLSSDNSAIGGQQIAIGGLMGRNARKAVQDFRDTKRMADKVEQLRRKQVYELGLDILRPRNNFSIRDFV